MSSDVLHFEMERHDIESGTYFVVTGVEIAIEAKGRSLNSAYRNLENALALYFEVDQRALLPAFKVTFVGPYIQCPCCDYFTIVQRGAYHICRVCFWEDDGQDVDELDYESGPNHVTLREARANFKKFGACDLAMKQYVLAEEERSRYKYRPRDID